MHDIRIDGTCLPHSLSGMPQVITSSLYEGFMERLNYVVRRIWFTTYGYVSLFPPLPSPPPTPPPPPIFSG